MRRLVTKKRAEINTFKAAQLKADALPPGAKKSAAQAKANAFKTKIAARAGA